MPVVSLRHIEYLMTVVEKGSSTLTARHRHRRRRDADLARHEYAVVPPHLPHAGVAGPEGATAIDVFTPPRAGIVAAKG